MRDSHYTSDVNINDDKLVYQYEGHTLKKYSLHVGE